MPVPAFPSTVPGWRSALPSLLAVCASAPLVHEGPIMSPDPSGADVELHSRAVALMAFEFAARCWVSGRDFSGIQSIAGQPVPVSQHFAFRELGVRPGADPTDVEWWRMTSPGGTKTASYYLHYTPPGSWPFAGSGPAPARPTSIYVDAMAGVMPYVASLVTAAEGLMGSEDFDAARAPWLAALEERFPGVYS